MPILTQSASALMLLALLLLTTLSACSKPLAGSETTKAMCRELRADLPTYSTRDTSETLLSGARFTRTFNAICED